MNNVIRVKSIFIARQNEKSFQFYTKRDKSQFGNKRDITLSRMLGKTMSRKFKKRIEDKINNRRILVWI